MSLCLYRDRGFLLQHSALSFSPPTAWLWRGPPRPRTQPAYFSAPISKCHPEAARAVLARPVHEGPAVRVIDTCVCLGVLRLQARPVLAAGVIACFHPPQPVWGRGSAPSRASAARLLTLGWRAPSPANGLRPSHSQHFSPRTGSQQNGNQHLAIRIWPATYHAGSAQPFMV